MYYTNLDKTKINRNNKESYTNNRITRSVDKTGFIEIQWSDMT